MRSYWRTVGKPYIASRNMSEALLVATAMSCLWFLSLFLVVGCATVASHPNYLALEETGTVMSYSCAENISFTVTTSTGELLASSRFPLSRGVPYRSLEQACRDGYSPNA